MNTPKLTCPYCDKELQEESNFCCGEAGHGEWKNMINEIIFLKYYRVYGVDRLFPDCPTSRSFTYLMNRKTFDQKHMDIIKSMGFSIIVREKDES